MQFHDTMSDEELLALTDEQVDDCARLLLAKDGLAFPAGEAPVVMSVKDRFANRVEGRVYAVGSYYFNDKEAAEAAANALTGSIRLESDYISGDHYYRSPDDGDWNKNKIVQVNVEMIPVYSRETLVEMKEHMKEREQAEKPLKEWQEQRAAFAERRSIVLNAVWDAGRRAKEKADREAYMTECLRLADNDQVIARRFFEKRYPAPANEQEET